MKVLRHPNRTGGTYPALNFGLEKAVGAMSGAFVHFGQQAQPSDHFGAVFDAI